MKSAKYIIPFLSILLCFLFTGCKEETDCGIKVTCKFTDDPVLEREGVTPGGAVANCSVNINTDITPKPGKEIAGYAKRSGTTNANGVYEATFEHEALLDINAEVQVYIESIDSHITYKGKGQVSLVAGEKLEIEIILEPEESK